MIHERDPNLEDQFTCNLCQRSFICKDSLTVHMTVHKKDCTRNVKYQFTCDLCQKSFIHKYSLLSLQIQSEVTYDYP